MFRRFLKSLVVTMTVAAPAAAQVRQVPIRPCPPSCAPGGDCMPVDSRCRPAIAQVVRSSSQVRAELDGRVVRYEVTETFTNRGGTVGEADYMLPLPKNAVFEDLALSING
jgi:hypothetical protein